MSISVGIGVIAVSLGYLLGGLKGLVGGICLVAISIVVAVLAVL